MLSDFFNPPQKKNGFHYFLYGATLCLTPGIRRFMILPLLANFILFIGMLCYLFLNLNSWINYSLSILPSWLAWLDYILIPVAVIVILGGFGYFFGTVANWIAAPFNGLLAEKLEAHLAGEVIEDEPLVNIIKDIPRIFQREWQKLLYCLPKALLIFLLFFIPVIGQTIVPIAWFVFSTWMLVIQYCDYPFDNHKVPFSEMKEQLKQDAPRCYSFGIMINIFTLIPLVNWFVMPIAVCGATAMWVDWYKPNINKGSNNNNGKNDPHKNTLDALPIPNDSNLPQENK